MENIHTAYPSAPRRVRPFRCAATAAALVIAAAAGLAVYSSVAAAARPSAARSAAPAHAAVRLRGPDPYEYLPNVPGFKLASASVRNGAPLPLAQLSKLLGVPGGEDISP